MLTRAKLQLHIPCSHPQSSVPFSWLHLVRTDLHHLDHYRQGLSKKCSSCGSSQPEATKKESVVIFKSAQKLHFTQNKNKNNLKNYNVQHYLTSMRHKRRDVSGRFANGYCKCCASHYYRHCIIRYYRHRLEPKYIRHVMNIIHIHIYKQYIHAQAYIYMFYAVQSIKLHYLCKNISIHSIYMHMHTYMFYAALLTILSDLHQPYVHFYLIWIDCSGLEAFLWRYRGKFKFFPSQNMALLGPSSAL